MKAQIKKRKTWWPPNLIILFGETIIAIIKSAATPTIPYVAPTKKKLLLYAVRAVGKREHTQKQKTYSGAAVLSCHDSFKLTAAFKERLKKQSSRNLDRKNQWKQKNITDASKRRVLTFWTVWAVGCCYFFPHAHTKTNLKLTIFHNQNRGNISQQLFKTIRNCIGHSTYKNIVMKISPNFEGLLHKVHFYKYK